MPGLEKGADARACRWHRSLELGKTTRQSSPLPYAHHIHEQKDLLQQIVGLRLLMYFLTLLGSTHELKQPRIADGAQPQAP